MKSFKPDNKLDFQHKHDIDDLIALFEDLAHLDAVEHAEEFARTQLKDPNLKQIYDKVFTATQKSFTENVLKNMKDAIKNTFIRFVLCPELFEYAFSSLSADSCTDLSMETDVDSVEGSVSDLPVDQCVPVEQIQRVACSGLREFMLQIDPMKNFNIHVGLFDEILQLEFENCPHSKEDIHITIEDGASELVWVSDTCCEISHDFLDPTVTDILIPQEFHNVPFKVHIENSKTLIDIQRLVHRKFDKSADRITWWNKPIAKLGNLTPTQLLQGRQEHHLYAYFCKEETDRS